MGARPTLDATAAHDAVREHPRLALAPGSVEVSVGRFLDGQHRRIVAEEPVRGTLEQTPVHPREVARTALARNAAAVIFAHNHPSGVAEPSRADQILTRRPGARTRSPACGRSTAGSSSDPSVPVRRAGPMAGGEATPTFDGKGKMEAGPSAHPEGRRHLTAMRFSTGLCRMESITRAMPEPEREEARRWDCWGRSIRRKSRRAPPRWTRVRGARSTGFQSAHRRACRTSTFRHFRRTRLARRPIPRRETSRPSPEQIVAFGRWLEQSLFGICATGPGRRLVLHTSSSSMLGSVLSDLHQAWRRRRDAARMNRARSAGGPDSTSMASVGWRVFGGTENLQDGFDVAVVMPTILRPTVLAAVQSVFDQSATIRVQLLVGIDAALDSDRHLVDLLRRTPPHVTSFLFYPGYSTSVRHGGPQLARDGGSLRSALTYLANARRVAYLDDDNWWHPDHLGSMLEAIEGHDWAYSLRWFVHHQSREPICPDIWESVGPGEGVWADRFGGWVDPNCLMLDKIACDGAVRWWCTPLTGDVKGMSGDRRVYDYLQHQGPPGSTGRPTVFYTLQPDDLMHPTRVDLMGAAYSEADRRAMPPRA